MNQQDAYRTVAEKILLHSLNDPQLGRLIETMLADETVTKKQLYDTAFAQGVISTLCAMKEGRIFSLSNN